ncbi:putative eXPORT/MEMBRANE PROTEIN [Mycobacterium kansasii 824]|uniref:Putative eXPORT/MEMBRANE PROTEIN n=1 Tax=Mycobacterium kansasii TaxID=1768 RepID=A0A1V3WDR0_MYCKA|nr:putative eXPORT/MEMBRANE PROTEIN [Mycobacterium kansasii 824]OOK64992.1 putative eXPORT/MEMBRANE PROTEIN [Mycobacterium kansasii]
MNSGTLVGSLIFATVLVVTIAAVLALMMRGWRRRAQQQAERIGELPDVPGRWAPRPPRSAVSTSAARSRRHGTTGSTPAISGTAARRC